MSNICRKQMEANTTEVFQIDSPTTAFLVKNYTGSTVYVCAGKQYRDADSVMVAAGTAEAIRHGTFLNTAAVRATSAGVVEVGRYDGRQIFPLAGGTTHGQGTEISEEDVTSDEEFDEMMDEIFGDSDTPSGEGEPDSPSDEIGNETVTTDEEFDEMMDEIFGDDSGAGSGSSQGDGPDLDDPGDDEP